MLQKITTQEPDDAQLEVSLRALEATLELEQYGLPVTAKLVPETVMVVADR